MHWLTRYRLGIEPKPELIAVLQDVPDEDPPSPEMPTGFFCGSREKVAVMRQRAEAGVGIFHDGDSIRKIVPRWDVWGKRVPWE